MWRNRLVQKGMQRYWRWQRALTLGARGMVLDESGRVLLIRHTYTPGWQFPGGGVELGETLVKALQRELLEEVNVRLTEPPELFGIFSNESAFPGDHVALYVVRKWRQDRLPKPTFEIAEVRFFATDDLPEETTRGTRRRLDEFANGLTRTETW
ncbi:MAG: NUDIX domain-containing protein [Hyphomicrobiaceae bacterium]